MIDHVAIVYILYKVKRLVIIVPFMLIDTASSKGQYSYIWVVQTCTRVLYHNGIAQRCLLWFFFFKITKHDKHDNLIIPISRVLVYTNSWNFQDWKSPAINLAIYVLRSRTYSTGPYKLLCRVTLYRENVFCINCSLCEFNSLFFSSRSLTNIPKN